MPISTRIAVGFATVLLLTAFVGTIGWTSLINYATGVSAKGQMSALVSRLDQATLLLASFSETGDPAHRRASGQRLPQP